MGRQIVFFYIKGDKKRLKIIEGHKTCNSYHNLLVNRISSVALHESVCCSCMISVSVDVWQMYMRQVIVLMGNRGYWWKLDLHLWIVCMECMCTIINKLRHSFHLVSCEHWYLYMQELLIRLTGMLFFTLSWHSLIRGL